MEIKYRRAARLSSPHLAQTVFEAKRTFDGAAGILILGESSWTFFKSKVSFESQGSSGQPATPPEQQNPTPAVDRGPVIAFLVSVVVIGGIVLGVGLMVHNSQQRRLAALANINRLSPRLDKEATAIPNAAFTDVTSDSGIRFSHTQGAYGEKLLPETMGGGVAFIDFDNDGAQDLLFVNSTFWPGKAPAGKRAPTMALYRNDGKGHFHDVTAGSGLDVSFYGMGVAVGDYDNDGFDDVFITGVGGNHLFHNEGKGKFTEITQAAGLTGDSNAWSTGAAFIDYDNDGKLDLFVCNYVRWSRDIDLQVNFTLPGVGRAYGRPMNFEGSFPFLYHNEGNGHFKDVSRQSGVQVTNKESGLPLAKALAVAPVDADNDGWIDLVVANDTVQNFLFRNQHDGTFKEIGASSSIAFDVNGRARGAMGIDSARFREGEALGIGIGNFANEMNALYVSQRDSLLFTDEASNAGVGPASEQLLKFGLFFFDYDLDSRLDLLTVNGHLDPDIGKVQKGQQYRQPAQLFWNGGNKEERFIPAPPQKCGRDIFKPIVGRGSAFADIDGDGDPDVIMTQVGGPPVLLRNDQQLKHHWIRLKLTGTRSNRDGIGAWIKARFENHTVTRQVMPTRSYLSQSELPVTIGLGTASSIQSVEITWPGGSVQKVEPLPKLDALTRVIQPQ
jgi:hypothetical protein